MTSHGNANPGPATEKRGDSATVDVMTAMTRKRWLFFRWDAPEWRTLDRGAALRTFEERFLAYPFRMVVVGPDFSSFDRRRGQSFVFMPLAAFAARRSTAAELAFLRRCIARVPAERGGPGEAGEVAYLDGRFVAEPARGVGVAWTAPFATVEGEAQVLSRRACLERILPALRSGIGGEESGLYMPYGGEGVFHLLSV